MGYEDYTVSRNLGSRRALKQESLPFIVISLACLLLTNLGLTIPIFPAVLFPDLPTLHP